MQTETGFGEGARDKCRKAAKAFAHKAGNWGVQEVILPTLTSAQRLKNLQASPGGRFSAEEHWMPRMGQLLEYKWFVLKCTEREAVAVLEKN